MPTHGSEDQPNRGPRSQARPDHHDPTGGLWGAAPAASALTLRMVLAVLGLVTCIGGVVWSQAVDGPLWLVVVLVLLAVVAVIDIVVIARRKARGEPG